MMTDVHRTAKSLHDLTKTSLGTMRRRKSYVTDLPVKHKCKRQILDVQKARQTLSETNLISGSLDDEFEREILSPIIPHHLQARLVNRRISVSNTKLSPPFIKTASYMIISGRVSFQDLVICVLHCLQHLMGTKGKVLAPNDDISVKQICYEIAFNVLKYRTVILEVMEESQFYSTFPHLYDTCQLVTILAYIQYIIAEPLPKDNVYNSEIRTILRSLFVHKIHIDASFARSRIKLNAATVIHLLSKEDRDEYVKSTQIDDNAPPYYARINKVKNTQNDVIGALQEHFKYFPSAAKTNKTNPGFYRDPEFKDLLVFSSSLREELTGLHIVREAGLVLQERVLSYVISTLSGLLMRGYDVIQTHAGSGSLATYLASVVDGNKCKLRVCGCPPGDIPHIQRNITKQGIKNMELTSLPFLNYEEPDKPPIQAVICTPPSTMSAVREPFRYALYEGDYSVAGEKVNKQQTSLRQFVVHQTKTLRQALSYRKVSTVVYFTLSSNYQENEGVVRNCVEEFNEKCENPDFRFSPIPVLPEVRRLIWSIKEQSGDKPPTKEFFKTIPPEAGFAGGFITVLYRKMPEDPKASVPEIPATISNRNNSNIPQKDHFTTLPQPKKKKKGAPKVISMDTEIAPIIGDFSKLGLVERGPSLQAFKKDFIQNYEMVMGPGSRAKLNKVKQIKHKKEVEPVFPKVSLVVTKAMEQRKRQKVKPLIIHQQVIAHPHPFK